MSDIFIKPTLGTVGSVAQDPQAENQLPQATNTEHPDWPIHHTFKLYDTDIATVSEDGILFFPTHFLESDDCHNWAKQITPFLQSGGAVVLATPWIAGSISLDINGQPRTARSHVEKRAIDITPVWSDPQLLDPDGANPALAWNLCSLSALCSLTTDTLAWAVEGDHIHISTTGVPSLKREGYVLCAPTLSTAYPLTKVIQAEKVLQPLFSGPHAFHVTTNGVWYEPIETEDLFQAYLEGGTSITAEATPQTEEATIAQ